MRSSVFAATLVGVSGHGHMTLPPSTRIPGANLLTGGSCTDGQCNWFTNNIQITGPETLPEQFRTVTNGGSPDVFAGSPWRSPGTAVVYGSGCGVAGGGPDRYANGGNAPPGIDQNTDGYHGLSKQKPTTYQIGSEMEVAWAISANHGGGYHYRLCKVSDGISEECFQKTPLKFSGTNSYILHSDGSVVNAFPRRLVTEGTFPAGSEWAMDPVPGCKICEDAQSHCGDPMDPVPQDQQGGKSSDPWNSQVECYGLCCGAGSSKAHGACEAGTEFYEPLSGKSGFGKDVPEWSIADKVIIPADLEEGEYVLGWRWDCEESTQVWQNCADIYLTHDTPPPVPSPSPSPSPAPKPSTCKAEIENPTCQNFGKGCKEAGCQKCADGTTYNCAWCCAGCEMNKKGGVAYCDDPAVAV